MATPVAHPRRVQARRDRNYVAVHRPSRWQNPYRVQPHGRFTRGAALRLFEAMLRRRLAKDPRYLEPLRGFHLGCLCAPHLACHADILLRYLYERPAGPRRRQHS